MLMDWLKKAPTGVVISVILTVGGLLLTVIIGFIVLIGMGQDTTEFRSFVNTLMNGLMLALSGVGAVAGVSAARSAGKAEDQTNGTLTAKDDEIAALRHQLNSAQRNGPF